MVVNIIDDVFSGVQSAICLQGKSLGNLLLEVANNQNSQIEWRNGKLSLFGSTNSDAYTFQNTASDFQSQTVHKGFLNLIDMRIQEAIDRGLILSEAYLHLSTRSPLFRIPANADHNALCVCLIAVRLLVLMKEAVLPPANESLDNYINLLDSISFSILDSDGYAIYSDCYKILDTLSLNAIYKFTDGEVSDFE